MTYGARALKGAVRAYQRLVSPLTGSNCRFHPTCSAYAYTAVERHGALRGSYLALRRIGRCHPFSRGGFDEVPTAFQLRGDHRAEQGEREA